MLACDAAIDSIDPKGLKMAQYVQTTTADVQPMTVIQAEEAAAVGVSYTQQQPPPQQHVVQMTTYPHIAQNVYVIDRQTPMYISPSGEFSFQSADGGNVTLKAAVAQTVQSTLQAQPVQQEIQTQKIPAAPQQYQTIQHQVQVKPIVSKAYSVQAVPAQQLKQQVVVCQPAQCPPKKLTAQQSLMQHLAQQPQGTSLPQQPSQQQILVQSVQRSAQHQPQGIQGKAQTPQQIPTSAGTPQRQQTVMIASMPLQRPQLKPQLRPQQPCPIISTATPNNRPRPMRPRLLQNPKSLLSPCTTAVQHQQVALAPTVNQSTTISPANVQQVSVQQAQSVSLQQQTGQPFSQLGQQNGIVFRSEAGNSPTSAGDVLANVNANVTQGSQIRKTQIVTKRRVSVKKNIAGQQSVVMNQAVHRHSPQEQTNLVQIQQPISQVVNNVCNQSHVATQQNSVTQSLSPQVQPGQITYVAVKTPNQAIGQNRVQSPRIVFQPSINKQILSRQLQQQVVIQQQQSQPQVQQQIQQPLSQQQLQLSTVAASQSIQTQHGIQIQLTQQMQQVPGQPQILQIQPQFVAQQQAQQQVQLQAQQQAQLQAQQQAQLQAQQQAQLQAQQQAQLQAQQQAQLQAQQQAQLQAQQQAQLQAQQQAQLQAQQRAQQQAQLQAQQQAQLQAPQESEEQTKQADQEQIQVESQQLVQQTQEQARVQHQQLTPPFQLVTQKVQQQYQQLQAQIQITQKSNQQVQLVHQQNQLQSQQVSKVAYQTVAQNQERSSSLQAGVQSTAVTLNRGIKNLPNHNVNQHSALTKARVLPSLNVAQSHFHNESHSKSQVIKKINEVDTAQVTPLKQVQPETPQSNKAVVLDDKVSTILRQLIAQQKEGFTYRILQHFDEMGNNHLTIQEVPVETYSQVQQVEEASDSNIQQEEVALYEGVTVEDEFPTGVPQECFVSESGELLIANDSTVKVEAEMDVDVKEENCDSTETNEQQTIESEHSVVTNSVQVTPTLEYVSNEEHKLVKVQPGVMALCPHCGIYSSTLSKCLRCSRRIPEDAKTFVDQKIAKSMKPYASIASIASPIRTNTITSVLLKRDIMLPIEKTPGKPFQRSLNPSPGVVTGLDAKRKRCSTTKRARAKAATEEPEILTLSSDDEEKQDKKPEMASKPKGNGIGSLLDAEAKAMEADGEEESDINDETKKQSEAVEGGGMLEQAMEGSISPPFVSILCRTVRIGTYKAKPCERVALSAQGLEIKLPLPTGSDVTIAVPMLWIRRVLVSFCRSMPVLFIYLRDPGGPKVRETLHMTDAKGAYYFDPNSSDETHKRITLLPEKLLEEQKLSIKKIFASTKKVMAEIDNGLANDILVKSSPCESVLRAKLGMPGNEIKTLMVYPPPPAKGGISINTEDYACLGEDQFLNDVIIDFYLKYLMQSVLSEEDRERTHVFSSFFYKRLTSRPKTKGRKHPIEDDPKLSPAEKRHARVKGWTKSVNLFSKDFIIIPINENCHWFLAIVCFPGQNGCLKMSDNTPIDLPKPPSTSAAAVAAAAAAAASTNAKLKVKDNVMSIGSTTITPVKAAPPATITLDHNGEDGSDRDEAEGDEEEMEDNSSEDEEAGNATNESCSPKDEELKTEANTKVAAATVNSVVNSTSTLKKGKQCLREAIKQPCILIFDSLVGAPRYRVAATLREYLNIEYKVKEKKVKEFTKDTIKGMLPKVPQQTNFTDCGLYLLQYVEMFFKDPIKDYHHPIKQLLQWFPEEIVSRKREDIVNLLQDLMKEQNIDPASLSLPQLVFTHNTVAQLKAQQQAEDEEALAKLAEADREAEEEVERNRLIAKKQLADLQAQDKAPKLVAMDVDLNYQSEEVVPHRTLLLEEGQKCEDVSLPPCESDGNISLQSALGSRPSLVDYSESSNESSGDNNSLVKRTQSEVNQDEVERKKMRND